MQKHLSNKCILIYAYEYSIFALKKVTVINMYSIPDFFYISVPCINKDYIETKDDIFADATTNKADKMLAFGSAEEAWYSDNTQQFLDEKILFGFYETPEITQITAVLTNVQTLTVFASNEMTMQSSDEVTYMYYVQVYEVII